MKREMESIVRSGFLNKVKREIIIPEVRGKNKKIGNFYYVNISFLEDDVQHAQRYHVLKMFNKGMIYTLRNIAKSEYYKNQKAKKGRSRKDVWKKLLKYYFLFKSISKHGFKVNIQDLDSFPWIFVAKDVRSRFDGHHRASIAKYLGYNELPALVVTPSDILSLKKLPDDIKSNFEKFEEPDLKGYRPYEI